MDTVSEIKSQYARILNEKDWANFKEIAEYYLKIAAKLKNKDIKSRKNILLLRNSQKRLFIGIGCELLLKSFYLKKGYCINKIKSKSGVDNTPTHKLSLLDKEYINHNDTFTIGTLIDNLDRIVSFSDYQSIRRGFQIAMVFRNKEGHVTFPSHEFNESNYKDITQAVISFYSECFKENLKFNISMKPNEKHVFKSRI